MSEPTDELVQSDAIIAQYRAELERLNYVRGWINVYLRSIRRLFGLMEEQGVAPCGNLGGMSARLGEDQINARHR